MQMHSHSATAPPRLLLVPQCLGSCQTCSQLPRDPWLVCLAPGTMTLPFLSAASHLQGSNTPHPWQRLRQW